ncbi:unnamed protein product [Cylicocyclus nassatus]|uniref:Uncharacterized protein n=1 Tax=Cylicocyclus nassatus TaxID=53992 RepID=A0AA36H456_CYLNA|nr:unnamed protein product [Cylicocyclus nassatus]
MEEIVIPKGKQLRFRCNFKDCVRSKSFSIVSVMDHLALHFSEIRGSKRVYNYYCKKCGVNFFLCGMCLGCKCNAKGGGEQFVQLKEGKITIEDIKREAQFFSYVHKWIVPVLENVPGAQPTNNRSTNGQASADTDNRRQAVNEASAASQERRSRSRTRRPPVSDIRSMQANTSRKRPVPPPLPQRRVSRSPGPNSQNHMNVQETTSVAQGSSTAPTARRSRSTVRRPPVKNRQDSLLENNPSPPPRRQISRSPGPRSRTPSGEEGEAYDMRSSGGETYRTMPTPMMSPRFGENGDLGSNYSAGMRSRSQSRCGTPAMNGEGRYPAKTTGDEEGRTSASWNSAMPMPQLFNNIYTQQNFSSSSASCNSQNGLRASAAGTSQKKSSQEESGQRKEVRKQSNSLPEPVPPPVIPPPAKSVVTSSPLADLLREEDSPPPPKTSHTAAPSDGHSGIATNDPVTRLPPPPPPPASLVDVKPSSETRRSSLPSAAKSDNATKRRASGTVRTVNKKSRQDSLLEENPPPPTPRHGARSPGPLAPRSPFYGEPGSKTPAHTHNSVGAHTPGYGSTETFVFPAPGTAAQTPAYGSATPYSSRSPRYSGGSPDYGSGAPSLYGGRTPRAGSSTPYNSGYRTPVDQGSHTPFYPRTPAYGDRSPARTPNYGPSTPRYGLDDFDGIQNGGNRTPRSRTPNRSYLDTSNATTSKENGDSVGAGYTPLRIPERYADGTPRSPRYEDDEEEQIPLYQRSPRYAGNDNGGDVTCQSTDPLSLNSRAKTPPPPSKSPPHPNPPAVNGFGNTSQQTMPPFAQSFPFTAPFGQNWGAPPFNPFALPSAVPPPPPPQQPSSSNGIRSQTSSTAPNRLKESNHVTKSSAPPQRAGGSNPTPVTKLSAPPQRAGGSKFINAPPPAKNKAAPTSKPRRERKRRRSYDRSDSD